MDKVFSLFPGTILRPAAHHVHAVSERIADPEAESSTPNLPTPKVVAIFRVRSRHDWRDDGPTSIGNQLFESTWRNSMRCENEGTRRWLVKIQRTRGSTFIFLKFPINCNVIRCMKLISAEWKSAWVSMLSLVKVAPQSQLEIHRRRNSAGNGDGSFQNRGCWSRSRPTSSATTTPRLIYNSKTRHALLHTLVLSHAFTFHAHYLHRVYCVSKHNQIFN